MGFMWPFFVRASSTFFLVNIYHYHLQFGPFYAAEIVISITVLGKTHRNTELGVSTKRVKRWLSWMSPGMCCCFQKGDCLMHRKHNLREVVQIHMGLVLEQLMDLMDLVDLGAFFVWEPSGK